MLKRILDGITVNVPFMKVSKLMTVEKQSTVKYLVCKTPQLWSRHILKCPTKKKNKKQTINCSCTGTFFEVKLSKDHTSSFIYISIVSPIYIPHLISPHPFPHLIQLFCVPILCLPTHG